MISRQWGRAWQPDDAPPEAVLGEGRTHRKIAKVESLAQEATTPLRRWEDGLELPVALVVLPLFVFMNAGLPVDSDGLAQLFADPVGLGVMVAPASGALRIRRRYRLSTAPGLPRHPQAASGAERDDAPAVARQSAGGRIRQAPAQGRRPAGADRLAVGGGAGGTAAGRG